MTIGKVRLVTKRSLEKECHAALKCTKGKPWRLLFIEVIQCDSNNVWFSWSCPFTPWRLFATFFVKSSKYYKARMEPW